MILKLVGVQGCVFGSVRRRVSWEKVSIGVKPYIVATGVSRSLRLVPLNAVRCDPTGLGMIWYLRLIISNFDMTSQDGVLEIVCVCVSV